LQDTALASKPIFLTASRNLHSKLAKHYTIKTATRKLILSVVQFKHGINKMLLTENIHRENIAYRQLKCKLRRSNFVTRTFTE
jgi:hypothetical protein